MCRVLGSWLARPRAFSRRRERNKATARVRSGFSKVELHGPRLLGGTRSTRAEGLPCRGTVVSDKGSRGGPEAQRRRACGKTIAKCHSTAKCKPRQGHGAYGVADKGLTLAWRRIMTSGGGGSRGLAGLTGLHQAKGVQLKRW